MGKVLDIINNHNIIFIMLGIGNRKGKEDGPSKFKFQKIDDKAFFNILYTQQDTLQQKLKKVKGTFAQSEQKKRTLDFCIEQLLNAIHQSISVSTPKTKKVEKKNHDGIKNASLQ